MNIDRNEECGFCGMPRHAHWGGSQALVAGRCDGFKSTTETKLRAAAPDMLAALKAIRDDLKELGLWNYYDEAKHQGLSGACADIDAAIAKAEGRGDG